jgi:hypothetical protein
MRVARDVLAPRAVLVKDDDDGGTKALAVIAVESRRRSAALVVFIAAVFSLVSIRIRIIYAGGLVFAFG